MTWIRVCFPTQGYVRVPCTRTRENLRPGYARVQWAPRFWLCPGPSQSGHLGWSPPPSGGSVIGADKKRVSLGGRPRDTDPQESPKTIVCPMVLRQFEQNLMFSDGVNLPPPARGKLRTLWLKDRRQQIVPGHGRTADGQRSSQPSLHVRPLKHAQESLSRSGLN